MTKKCPFCAEQVQLAAIVCPHCTREFPAAGVSVSALGWIAPPPYAGKWKLLGFTDPETNKAVKPEVAVERLTGRNRNSPN